MTTLSVEMKISVDGREMGTQELEELVGACLKLVKYSSGLTLNVGDYAVPLQAKLDDVAHLEGTIKALLARNCGFALLVGGADGDMVSDTGIRINGKPATRRQVEGMNLRVDNKAFLSRANARILNCLKNDNIDFLGGVLRFSEAEMLRMPNFGRHSMNLLRRVLQDYGLDYACTVEGWVPPEV